LQIAWHISTGELKQSNMARDAYDYMIDLAEKTYNIPVRKNSGAK
jgi:hypothetical protein